MDAERIPSQVFCVGEHVDEELIARGWTVYDLAERMGGDVDENIIAIGLMFFIPQRPGLLLGEVMAARLERAFGVSAQFWLNLDVSWRRWPDRQTPFTPQADFPAATLRSERASPSSSPRDSTAVKG